MKKLLIAILLCGCGAVSGYAQSIPPTTWIEADGSPKVTPATKIIVPNGSISGKTVTLTGGGGGGCTPPGTLGRILYDDGAGGCLSITGATTNGTFVTLTTPVLGVATGTSLALTGNVQVGIAALYKFGGSNSFSYTDSVGPKWTDGNTVQDLIFNVQSLTANRTVTWPDASGTATLLGNSSTGSGAVVLTGTPTIATPSFTTGFTIGGTAATGTIPRGNGTNFVASSFTMAAPGTSGNVLTSDGTNWTSAAPASAGANTALSNLASVSINASLIPQTTLDLGAAATAWRDIYFYGAGTFGSHSIKLTGTPTGNRTATFPDNTGTVAELNLAQTFTANQAITSTVTTGTGTSSGFSVAADSLTTGTGANFASSSVTSGSVVNIASTSTAAASSTLKGLNIAISGANSTTAQTVTGASISVTNTNATSGTNIALAATASGATTANYAAVFTGLVALGGTASSFPAIKRNGSTSTTAFRSGDDSGYAAIFTATTYAVDSSTNLLAYLDSGIKGLGLAANGVVVFSNTNDSATATKDLTLRRAAAANLAFGAADAASPVAQTMSVQNVVAGTSNTAGASWTHAGSRGTGTGVGGDIIFQTAPAGSSGTSQNALAAAFTVKGEGTVELKTVTFANLPTVANARLIYCSDCTIASPCASGGSGALAKGINGAWVCN